MVGVIVALLAQQQAAHWALPIYLPSFGVKAHKHNQEY